MGKRRQRGRLRHTSLLFAACLTAAAMSTFAAGDAAASGRLTEFPLAGDGTPGGIAAGPVGRLWFIRNTLSPDGRVTATIVRARPDVGPEEFAARLTEFPLTTAAGAIVRGRGDDLWFSERAANRIGRVTPGGEIAEFPLPAWRGEPGWENVPGDIVPGLGGALWFTAQPSPRLAPNGRTVENGGGGIGRVTRGGQVSLYPFPDDDILPGQIAAGSDGSLWVAAIDLSSPLPVILRVARGGAISKFTVRGATYVHGIALGPDGNVWFTATAGGSFRPNFVGRIGRRGKVSRFPIPSQGPRTILTGRPTSITAGPDGNLWFTESNPAKIGRITPTGQITELPLAVPSSSPNAIASGPDGNLWFSEGRPVAIARLEPGEIGIDVTQRGTSIERPIARFRLACAGGGRSGLCSGAIRIRSRRPPGELVFLTGRHYRLRSGRSKVVKLGLNRRALRRIAIANRTRQPVLVSATVRGGPSATRAIALRRRTAR